MFSLLPRPKDEYQNKDILTCTLRCWRYTQFSTFLRIYTGAQGTSLYETV